MIFFKASPLPHSRVLPGDGWFLYLMHKLTGSLFDKKKGFCMFLTALREGHFTDIPLDSSDVHTCSVRASLLHQWNAGTPPSQFRPEKSKASSKFVPALRQFIPEDLFYRTKPSKKQIQEISIKKISRLKVSVDFNSDG